jgi:hypothetical protein
MKILKGIIAILFLPVVYFIMSYVLGCVVGFSWGMMTTAVFPENWVMVVCFAALILSILITAAAVNYLFEKLGERRY